MDGRHHRRQDDRLYPIHSVVRFKNFTFRRVFVKTLSKVLVAVSLLTAVCFAQANYGTYRDSGGGVFSNQGWCNEVTQGQGTVTGCAPNFVATAYTTTAQAAANVSTDQKLVELALPANTLIKAGKTLIIKGAGTYSLGASSVESWKVKLCTVSGCGSGTVVVPCTWTLPATNANTGVTSSFNFECVIGTSTSSGANSKVLGHGTAGIEVGAANTAALSLIGDISTGETGTIDLTGTIFVDTTITFATANASNTATQQMSVAILGASAY
jgi:hypothetical protein